MLHKEVTGVPILRIIGNRDISVGNSESLDVEADGAYM
jgi:hypothetical protein